MLLLKLKRIEQGLLFATLLFLPTQLGKHFWPNFSFVYSLPIDYLSPTIYFWDLLVVFLLLSFILQRKPVQKVALNLYLLFFLTQVLSLAPQAFNGNSLNLGAGLVRAEQYLIAGLFGVYLASINLAAVKPIIFWSLSLSAILYIISSPIFNFDYLSLIRREELSRAAIAMWSSSKFLGIGLNNFIPTSSDQIVVGPSRFLQPVHNIFLLVLSETGLIGLLGLIGLIGYPIFRLLKNPILLLWMIIIFLGMFDHYFLTLPQGYRMLFLVWGLSLSVLK